MPVLNMKLHRGLGFGYGAEIHSEEIEEHSEIISSSLENPSQFSVHPNLAAPNHEL
jgi:hypothetical protein